MGKCPAGVTYKDPIARPTARKHSTPDRFGDPLTLGRQRQLDFLLTVNPGTQSLEISAHHFARKEKNIQKEREEHTNG